MSGVAAEAEKQEGGERESMKSGREKQGHGAPPESSSSGAKEYRVHSQMGRKRKSGRKEERKNGRMGKERRSLIGCEV